MVRWTLPSSDTYLTEGTFEQLTLVSRSQSTNV